jgi:probable HAF family extracellular repeat protein
MTDLGTLGGFSSEGRGINDRGQVVGYSDTPTSNGELHGFLWQDGTMTDLGTNFIPSGINNRGQIVGNHRVEAGQVLLWEQGELQQLPGFGTASGINDIGKVAGYSATVAGEIHATLWTRK